MTREAHWGELDVHVICWHGHVCETTAAHLPVSPVICHQHNRFRRFGDLTLRSRVYDKALCLRTERLQVRSMGPFYRSYYSLHVDLTRQHTGGPAHRARPSGAGQTPLRRVHSASPKVPITLQSFTSVKPIRGAPVGHFGTASRERPERRLAPTLVQWCCGHGRPQPR